MSSLPPPLRDSSGKIFVAIPAPSFIFTQDTPAQYPTANDAPNYVYVEYKLNGPHPLPPGLPPDQTVPTELKSTVSINTWVNNSCVAEPPPGHIPWSGEVSPDSSSGTESTCAEDVLDATKSGLGCAIFSNPSMSSFDIPSIPTCNTLLDGFLPSTCSSAWSGGFVPPSISVAKSGGKSSKRTSLAAHVERKHRSTSKHYKTPDNQRYTICITSPARRREARVLNQHRTSVKTGSLHSSNVEVRSVPCKEKMMSQIDELDDFFSEGLKKMDRTVLRLIEEQNKVKPPSLVVSTSSNIRPISLASSSEDSTTTSKTGSPTLAKRRGKDTLVPLKLDNCAGLNPVKPVLEYPDIPTAFRGSPGPTTITRFDEAKYPALKLDTKMTTDQMICSLREQVESFYPQQSNSERKLDPFVSQCKEAETWLQDELVQSPCKSEANPNDRTGMRATLNRDLSRPAHSFLVDVSQIENIARIQVPQVVQADRVQSLHANMARMPAEELASVYAEIHTPKTKPRKSILSNHSGSSCGSTKKVRFSEGSPAVILPAEHPAQTPSVPAPATNRTTLMSPKRKPVPLIGSIKSPTETRNSLPVTPTKPSSMRRPSPLNPGSKVTISTPTSHPPLKRSIELTRPALDEKKMTPTKARTSSPFRKGSLIFSRAANVSAPQTTAQDLPLAKKSARPLSFGANLKENRERSFSIATITKRRSFAAVRNDADKENQRDSKIAELVAQEAQKKGGRRSLPFQGMLSRLRG